VPNEENRFYRCSFCYTGFNSSKGVYHDATLFDKGYYVAICPKCGGMVKSKV